MQYTHVAMLEIAGTSYLEAHEVCELLGVKPATLYAYVSRGRLRSYRQGIHRRRLYRRDEVEALLRPQPGPQRSGEPKQRQDLPDAADWVREG